MGKFLLFIAGICMAYVGFKGLQKNADKPFEEKQAQLNELAKQAEIKRQMEIDDAIVNKRLLKGMTPYQVISSWGEPDRRESTMRGDYRYEIWVYGDKAIGFMDFGTRDGLRLNFNHPARAQ